MEQLSTSKINRAISEAEQLSTKTEKTVRSGGVQSPFLPCFHSIILEPGPRSSVNNVVYETLVYVELFRGSALCRSVCNQVSNLKDVLFSQLRAAVPFSTHILLDVSVPAFLDCVQHVGRVVSKKQMANIDTLGIIAFVTDEVLGSKLNIERQHERQAVCTDLLAVKGNAAISLYTLPLTAVGFFIQNGARVQVFKGFYHGSPECK
jgi:hypothetical protein